MVNILWILNGQLSIKCNSKFAKHNAKKKVGVNIYAMQFYQT